MKRLTNFVPDEQINVNRKQFKGINLTDPEFDEPQAIDVILGSDVYSQVLMSGLRKGYPTAQQTTFGWVLMGEVRTSNVKLVNVTTNVDLNTQLKKFWELETVPEHRHMSKEDELAEFIYDKSVERTSSCTDRYSCKYYIQPRSLSVYNSHLR